MPSNLSTGIKREKVIISASGLPPGLTVTSVPLKAGPFPSGSTVMSFPSSTLALENSEKLCVSLPGFGPIMNSGDPFVEVVEYLTSISTPSQS